MAEKVKIPNPNIDDAMPGMTGAQTHVDTNPALNSPGTFGSQRTHDQNAMGYDNPIMAARAWMRENGIDPSAANPLVQRQLQAAAGANRLFDLASNLQHDGAGDFMDFFGGFMENRNTAGAGPMFSKAAIDQMIQQALQSAMTHTGGGMMDNPWGSALLNVSDVTPESGMPFAATPEMQATALKAFLAPAYQDVVNPFALQAITEGVDRSSVGWQEDMLKPGAPNMSSFLTWIMANGGMPGQGV